MKLLEKAIKSEITEEIQEKLTQYNKHIIEKNKQINLTGIKTEEESIIKNVYDSLTVYEEKYFPKNGKMLDLGSGGGFPGAILAILRKDMQITLMDSIGKKLKAVQEILEKLEIKNAKILHARAENAAKEKQHREQYDTVTARAVKRLNTVSEWAMPFLKEKGIFAAMKSKLVDEEISECEKIFKEFKAEIIERKKLTLPSGEEREILYIRKNGKCPKRFPRKIGQAEKNPL